MSSGAGGSESVIESIIREVDEFCVLGRGSLASTVGAVAISVVLSVLSIAGMKSVCGKSEMDAGALVRMSSRELVVNGKDVMSGDLVKSAAGKMLSRKSQSPVI